WIGSLPRRRRSALRREDANISWVILAWRCERSESLRPSLAYPPRGILPIEERELSVQLRPVAREHGGLGEEGFAHHGEELGRVLGGVLVDEGRSTRVDFVAKTFIGSFENSAPLRGVHSGARRRKIRVARSIHVDLVRESVDPHVVAALGRSHVFPGEDYRPARPGFPGEFLVEGAPDSMLVNLFLAHAEFAGIDDDADPTVVDVQAEI